MRPTNLRLSTAFSTLAIALVAACSSDDSAGLNSAQEAGTSDTGGSMSGGSGGSTNGSGGSKAASGGKASTGGALGSGGAPSGGASSSGGASGGGGTASGGAPATGGANGTGGAATGGSPATGGASGNGGAASGGAPATGGASGNGGAATGGASSTGGASGTGGAATGGTASTGGTSGTGGAATGGATSTGGTASTGGTNGTGGAATGGTASTGGTNGTGGAGPEAGPHMRVFVTSSTWNGDLKTAADGTSGLNGGDLLCQRAATNAGLGGDWVAWLSDSTTNAIDRIADVGPWYRIDGVKAFEDKAALTSNPLAAINVNENGTITNFLPWTGTKADGTRATATCQDWTSAMQQQGNSGLCGSSAAKTSAWTEGSALPCQIPYNLYCFEQ